MRISSLVKLVTVTLIPIKLPYASFLVATLMVMMAFVTTMATALMLTTPTMRTLTPHRGRGFPRLNKNEEMGNTKTGSQMLKEGARTKLQPKETTNQEKGKTKGGEQEFCPLVENPLEDCYCNNLEALANIEKAIYYCVKYFRDCKIYISIQKEKGHQISIRKEKGHQNLPPSRGGTGDPEVC